MDKLFSDFEFYYAVCERILTHYYWVGFEDLGITKEDVKAAYEDNTQPFDFLDWYAIKYDLNRIDKDFYNVSLSIHDQDMILNQVIFEE